MGNRRIEKKRKTMTKMCLLLKLGGKKRRTKRMKVPT